MCHLYSMILFTLFKGFLLKLNLWRPAQHNKCFDDQAFWEVYNSIVVFFFSIFNLRSCFEQTVFF